MSSAFNDSYFAISDSNLSSKFLEDDCWLDFFLFLSILENILGTYKIQNKLKLQSFGINISINNNNDNNNIPYLWKIPRLHCYHYSLWN